MNDPHLDRALRTVAACCRVARRVQQRLDEVRRITKDDRSPVTVADFAVQAIAAMALLEADAGALIVGEERADVLRSDDQKEVRGAVVDAVRSIRPEATEDDVLDAIDRCNHDATGAAYWALDPIDGTKGFLRGQQYAIALGRIEGGRVMLGIMGCPNLPGAFDRPLDAADDAGTMYAAARGRGAHAYRGCSAEAAPEPVAAAAYDGTAAVRICESVESAHSKQSDTARIIEAIGSPSAPVRLDSQCKYAVVARGQADAYLRLPTRRDYVEMIWDHAAGSLIAEEAGAVVTDVSGRPLDFARGRQLETNKGIVCAASGLHASLIDVIARLGIADPAADPAG